jgi:excisionase family DNA binding protein
MLTKKEASIFLKVSIQTLNRWMAQDRGPKYYKVGVLVRYRKTDLAAFLEKCPTGGGSPVTIGGEAA